MRGLVGNIYPRHQKRADGRSGEPPDHLELGGGERNKTGGVYWGVGEEGGLMHGRGVDELVWLMGWLIDALVISGC